MSSPLSDALSTLSDRGLRRLLGARTFLRGLDYARRKVVEEVDIGQASAQGRVRGSEAEPYQVKVELTADGIKSDCSCPAFAKAGQHCKHVAALLITVRDQARGTQPRRGVPTAPAIPIGPQMNEPKGRRRDRRRRNNGSNQMHALPPQVGSVPEPDAVASQTGIGSWLPPEGSTHPRPLEYRIHVRQGAITVTVLDTEARVPLLPSHALAWQALQPTKDREVLRLLARFESGNPRHPAVDVRGEDVAELMPLLKDRRVLLEPALMQLRFSEDVLRPRFDLELDGDRALAVKASFERITDKRRFHLSQGGWFEGAPGWQIDTSAGVAHPLHRRVSPAALRRILRSPTIAEPLEKIGDVIMTGLPKVALEVGADLPDLDQIAQVIDLEPSFRMHAQGELVHTIVSLYVSYGDLETQVPSKGLGPPVLIQPPDKDNPRVRCFRCDIAAQQQAVQKLLDLGLKPEESGTVFVADGDKAIEFWSDGIAQLPETWALYVPDDLVDTQLRSHTVVPFGRISSGMDWLNVKLTFESEGVGVSREELQRCLAAGQKFVKLEDGSYATIDPAQIKAVLEREVELMTVARNGKLPLGQAGRVQELENLLRSVGKVNTTAAARGLFEKLQNIDEISSTKKPRNLKAKLRPYQEQGLSWLKFIHDIGSGGVLADDMGLGKTLEAIALFLVVKAEVEHFCALVVAPTSVVPNWAREIGRFAPSLKVTVWHGADRKDQIDALADADVIITSYALLRRDVEMLRELDLTYCVLDEAQQIKNPASATAQAAKRIPSSRKLALTGTPIENRLSEIWSIFDFVSPSLLGPLDKFEEAYSRPIDQGDSKAAAKLRAIIHPFILRRTKLEVAKDLPDKIEDDRICELTPDQRTLYTQVVREVRAQVFGEVERLGLARSHIHILAGLTKLRQAACDPRLLGLPREFTDEDSGKLQALRDLIEECVSGGHKVLVFSQFVSMLTLIRRAFEHDGVKYEYLDGSTKDRSERVERFQEDPTITVFLISLKAGGTGLNLTAADTVIHFDPWWNPAVEDQATDRAHRIGQTRVVTTYRLIAQGTIEEKILLLKAKKKDLVNSVLTEDMGGAKKLTKSDLDDLFASD
ncbi:MAG: SNF2 helicase associated domain-containing protein [Deltaproteobacteria bacterium]|nr:SNF2 helicase associated domain-containing protein [Deltaproteobacteria bacterium]